MTESPVFDRLGGQSLEKRDELHDDYKGTIEHDEGVEEASPVVLPPSSLLLFFASLELGQILWAFLELLLQELLTLQEPIV